MVQPSTQLVRDIFPKLDSIEETSHCFTWGEYN